MRLFRRLPLSRRPASRRAVPKLELLEDRMLPTANPLFGEFQSALGLLDIHGSSANSLVTASLSATGFVQVSVGQQTASSDPHAAAYDPALAGATGQTLKAIQLNGNAGLDHLVLGNLSVAGGLAVQSDGVLDVQGQVRAAGSIQLSGQSVLLGGQVRADGSIGGDITVTAGSVLQSGMLEADGSPGNGGSIQVDVTGHYVATASSVTAANSTGTGGGGLVVIDGFSTGTLFSSGNYQANGAQGGEIDLFGQQVQLVGANINASGQNGGGWVRVGGDSPSDIAAHGGSAAGVSYADTTTVDATTTLTADALSAGNGGRIVVWSQNTTTFGGTLAAQGAGPTGTGGLLEVSSAGQLTYGGHANATASSGKQGRLLLDPKNLTISAGVGLPQFNLVNPSPNSSDSFGASIVRLSNGNVVVTDSTATSGAGAVYLYDGQTGALLGTLTGSTSGDQVGSGGITVLNNGNFVVSSPSWQNGGAAVGAATWIDGSTSFATTVSAANSLIGSTGGDQVGNSVTALANGNYVVASPDWHNAGAMVGAVTWGDGVNGTFGAVIAGNSLVGSTDGDQIGIDGVTALTNGNYVVSSGNWHNPNGSAGAATWGNGAGGTIGPVAAVNSLVGAFSFSGDVGTNVTALSDGNYVVSSPGWNPDDSFSDVGAATWGNGSTGTVGVVFAGNSLIGTTGSFDSVAGSGVTALTNGNYVVISPSFQNGIGAVTWGAAGGGTIGTVSASNSLVGSTDGDQVGSSGVTALSNGSYVVSSPSWQIGSNDVGAVTWAAADGTTVGPVTISNSLVGSTGNDQVGSGGVTVLSNGNYVVSSPFWQNAGNDVGAVTWSLADGSTVGPVTTGNSLVGSTGGDQVGSGGVTALSNGDYVVSSPNWQNGAAIVGAVTWSLANGSTSGAVTTSNSFVGSTNGDQVGSGGVTALSNGNYLISSPGWQQILGHPLGAVTWSNGSTGQTLGGAGTINASNSLIGPGSPASLGQVLGLAGGTSFLARFTGNGGAVTLVQLAPQSETFATAAAQDLTLSPSFLTATLDTGTAVVLQASNDIKVNAPILVNNPTGNGGDLTLQAGRNIFISASITTDNGNLIVHANDTAADGVVNNERDGGGTAAITMTPGTSLNAGTGNVTVIEDTGAGNTNFASDDITAGDIIGNNVTLLNYGLGDGSLSGGITPGGGVDTASVTATGNLTVYSTLDISQAGALSPGDPDIVNVAGTTSLTATGNPLGVILLNNHANIFGGTVTYSDPGQDVEIAASGNLTLASTTTASTLTLWSGGILNSTGPLAVSGVSALSGASITLTDPQNNFQGLVNLNSTGAISLTNSSPFSYGVPSGELTLAGPTSLTAPSLTLIGTLDVGAQTLTLTSNGAADLNGSITLDGGTVSDSAGLIVGNGGTLSGSGTLQVGTGAADLVVQGGGTLSPDALIVNGDLTLASGSIYAEPIDSATQFGELNANGAINLGGATLTPAFQSPFQPISFGQFQFINNGGGNASTGQFAQGNTFAQGSAVFTLDYADGAANNVNLIVQGAPASVSSLPTISPVSFSVSWTGTEYAQGATAYNVYVSDNGGAYTLWQSDTTQTSATYTGELGHTYRFFSAYTDDAAILTPASQASTTVKVVPTITWSNPGDIIFGTPLSATQLDASASAMVDGSSTTVAGTYTYTPAAGAILGVGDNQTLSLSFTPADPNDFLPAQADVVINVKAATPTFSNLSSPSIVFGTPTPTLVSGHLNANAGSQNVPAAETVQVTLNGVTKSAALDGSDNFFTTFDTSALGVAGSAYPISFSYAGDANFNGATDGSSLTVNPASQTIIFNLSSPVAYSEPLTLSATGGASRNAVTFSVISGPAVVNGATLTFTGSGTVVVEADQAASANYAAAAPVQRTTLAITAYTIPKSENENGTPTAVTVSSLINGFYNDPDATVTPKPGIAVFQTNGNGTWQYSTNGTAWTAISNVSQAQALLLPGTDSVRFVPATNVSGQASLDFVGWDGSQGKVGGTANVTVAGGTTPFSANAGSLTVTVNPAPIWIGTGAALTSILPGTYSPTNPTTPAGNSVASVFGAYFHDDNPAVLSVGIAVNAVSGPTTGTWQYLTTVANATWTNFPLVSPTNVLLLSANDMIRFVPRSTFVGAATLNALAWDGSARPDATTVPPASLASSVFSKTALTAVEWVNRAPTLSLTPITAAPVPQYATGAAFTVASLLPKAGYADADGKTAPQGIAVTGTAPNGGFFQYVLPGGAWQTLPNVSPSAALLLPSTASLRLVAGSALGAATVTFEGWDQSQGSAGQTFNITSSGAATAFSTASTTLSITVATSTNHAPTLGTPGFTLAAATVSMTNSPITVSSLLQGHYADQDGPKAPQGIAITGAAAAGGVFQYLLAGGTWQALPSVSSSSALLLPSTASVRLVAGSQLGTAMLTFDGWDQTQGSAGQLFNIANSGGATAFSPTSATASIRVGQAPAWSATSGAALTALPPGNASPAGNTIGAVFGGFFLDIHPGQAVGVAVAGVSGNGTWQYSLTNGSSWVTFAPTLSKTSAVLLSANDMIRFVPKTTAAGTGTLTAYAWDGSVGTHGAPPVNLSLLGTGGASAFSATTLAAISAFNTAPTLTTTNVTLTPENENVATALSAATLLSRAGYNDVDGKTLSGIAVTGDNTGLPGTWQWLNGAVWTALPSVSISSAFLLPSATQLRFLPADNLAANTSGSATLTYLGWDETAGVADKTFALTGQGGVTAFSTASATASMLVEFVRQAPIWLSGSSASFTPVLGYSTTVNPTPNPAGDLVSAVFGSAFHDAAGAPVGIAISAQNTMSAGAWQYFANGIWNTFPTTLSTAAPLKLSASTLIRFLPANKSFSGTVSLTVYAWDGTTGAGSLSAKPLTATCLVNTAPTLTTGA